MGEVCRDIRETDHGLLKVGKEKHVLGGQII